MSNVYLSAKRANEKQSSLHSLEIIISLNFKISVINNISVYVYTSE